MSGMQKTINVFYCYDPEDKAFLDALDIHLGILKRQGKIVTWHDREVLPGKDKIEEISAHMNAAQIILLFVSPSFVHSHLDEVKQAMALHIQGRTCIIPILVRPVNYEDTLFNRLQPLPEDGKPITLWSNRDEAFHRIAGGIQKIVGDLSSR